MACSIAHRYQTDEKGSILPIFAIVFPTIFFLVGLTVDFYLLTNQKTELKQIADAAVLAAARELRIVDAKDPVIQEVGFQVAKSIATVKHGLDAKKLELKYTVNPEAKSVTIRIDYPTKEMFRFLQWKQRTIGVESEAKILGSMRVCVVALDPKTLNSIWLMKSAKLQGNDCAVYANSKSFLSLTVQDKAALKASLVCTAGGYDEGKGSITPEPVTDCPDFEDPLEDRIAPQPGVCIETDLVLSKGSHTLLPGTYCGGLHITDGAHVTLGPGLYIIDDGKLKVDKGATMEGEYVSFFLSGSKTTFYFDFDSHISLSAMKEGDLAGILFFEDRSGGGGMLASLLKTHIIRSDDARKLLGTIYLSKGRLLVDANNPVADESAYTALVVKQLWLQQGPTLTLNANYSETDVPVPEKIRDFNSNVILSK